VIPDRLEVGRIVRPHGLAGQVVVELVTNRLERVAPGASLSTADGRPLVVRASGPAPATGGRQRWLVSFDGVTSREAAEVLRDVVLTAAPIADPEALWVHELVGSIVRDLTGALLGTVVAVEANPASDLLVLDGGGLVPLRFVVDHRPGELSVDPPLGLFEA
jgi:16S rRNA processing protein RimM